MDETPCRLRERRASSLFIKYNILCPNFKARRFYPPILDFDILPGAGVRTAGKLPMYFLHTMVVGPYRRFRHPLPNRSLIA
jgi:hypothetical protein